MSKGAIALLLLGLLALTATAQAVMDGAGAVEGVPTSTTESPDYDAEALDYDVGGDYDEYTDYDLPSDGSEYDDAEENGGGAGNSNRPAPGANQSGSDNGGEDLPEEYGEDVEDIEGAGEEFENPAMGPSSEPMVMPISAQVPSAKTPAPITVSLPPTPAPESTVVVTTAPASAPTAGPTSGALKALAIPVVAVVMAAAALA